MKTKPPKDPAAVALGQKRWKGIEPEERAEIARAAVNERWANTSAKEKKAIGAKLAAARKKKARK